MTKIYLTCIFFSNVVLIGSCTLEAQPLVPLRAQFVFVYYSSIYFLSCVGILSKVFKMHLLKIDAE